MYSVIAIVNQDTFKKINMEPLTIEKARELRDFVDKSTQPKIVNENVIEKAIELNNAKLKKESKKS